MFFSYNFEIISAHNIAKKISVFEIQKEINFYQENRLQENGRELFPLCAPLTSTVN